MKIIIKYLVVLALFGAIVWVYLVFKSGQRQEYMMKFMQKTVPSLAVENVYAHRIEAGREPAYFYIIDERNPEVESSISSAGLYSVQSEITREEIINKFSRLGIFDAKGGDYRNLRCYSGVLEKVRGWTGQMVVGSDKVYLLIERY